MIFYRTVCFMWHLVSFFLNCKMAVSFQTGLRIDFYVGFRELNCQCKFTSNFLREIM
jgi:hypothetical protein